MSKYPRLEDIEMVDNVEDTKITEKISNIFVEYINKFGDNIALISGIPSETEIDELDSFINKFDSNHNGKELRQALVFISSQESYQDLISQKQIYFKSTFIIIDKCAQQLKEIFKINLELNQLQNVDEQQIKTNIHFKSETIQLINQQLILLNTSRYQEKEQNGIWSSLSMNDLFITKQIYLFLNFIIYAKPYILQYINMNDIPIQITKLINSLSLHEIDYVHIQILKLIINNFDKEQKLQLMQNQVIKTIARLLEHSNTLVKDDAINLLYNILDIEESRIDMRDEHPQYSNIKNEGIIHQIFLNCIINGETEEMKSKTAIVLGTLVRDQELDSYLKGKLIQQLKKDISNENSNKYIEKGLNVLCGLALKESNILEIISDNFIEIFITHSKSIVGNIKSYSLELLFMLTENGGSEVEFRIKNSIDLMNFLELIGDLDLEFDRQIINFLMKWNKDNENLQSINRLFNTYYKYRQESQENNLNILNNELIPIILSQFTLTNEILTQQEQDENITSEIIGIINSCYKILSLVTDDDETILIISKTSIPQQLTNILKQIPISQIKPIHLDSIENILIQENIQSNQQLYKFGIIQVLLQFLNHSSIEIVEIIVSIIKNIIYSGDYHCSSNNNCVISYPINSNHPYFNQLYKDEAIPFFEQNLFRYQSNESIRGNIIDQLTLLYRGHAFPLYLQDITLKSITRSIDNNIQRNEDIFAEIYQLQYLSHHQDNHESIIRKNILQLLISVFDNNDKNNKQQIIQIFNNIFENGNANIREQIKSIMPIEKISIIINRQNYTGMFSDILNDENQEQEKESFSQYFLNMQLFKLLAWQNEEQRMNLIIKIRNELINQYKKFQTSQEEQYRMDNFSILKMNINKNKNINLLKSIKQMISIIGEIKDKELIQGASLIVSEGIRIILFDQIQRWDEDQLIWTMDQLQIIINDSDDEMIFNLINDYICRSLGYIINECKQNIHSLLLKEKTVYLVLSIAEHGALMSSDYEYNHFERIINGLRLDFAIMDILEKKVQNQELILINKRIKLFAAIAFCYITKKYSLDQINLLNNCSTILQNKLISFIKQIQQQLIKFNNNFGNKSKQMNEQNNIENDEIELIEKVLFAIGCLGTAKNNAQFINKNCQIHDIILPLIHINCNCSQCISLQNSQFFINIISVAYFALAKLIFRMNQQQIDNLNLQHNILNHLISFIFTTSNDNNKNNEIFHVSSTYIFNHNNLISLNQKNNALYLLQSMLSKSNQIKYQLLKEQNLIEFINKFAIGEKMENKFTNESKLIQYRCLSIISCINKNASAEQIIDLINKYKEIGTISKIMSCSGGDGSDDDHVLSAVLTILINLFESLSQQNNESESKQIENELKDEIEKEGIYEETDNFLFHTDYRKEIGVKQCAINLKQQNEKYQDQNDNEEDEDQNDDENDEQN